MNKPILFTEDRHIYTKLNYSTYDDRSSRACRLIHAVALIKKLKSLKDKTTRPLKRNKLLKIKIFRKPILKIIELLSMHFNLKINTSY